MIKSDGRGKFDVEAVVTAVDCVMRAKRIAGDASELSGIVANDHYESAARQMADAGCLLVTPGQCGNGDGDFRVGRDTFYHFARMST